MGSTGRARAVEGTAHGIRIDAVERAAQLERILDNIPGAVVVTDGAGDIAQLNQAAALFLGVEPGGKKIQRWAAHLAFYLGDGKTEYPRVNLPLQRALRGETVEDQELVIRNGRELPGGWVAMSAASSAWSRNLARERPSGPCSRAGTWRSDGPWRRCK